MIIVSQDKCTIVNFNNIQNIRIEPYGTHIKGKKIYKIFAGNFEGYATELGTYDTEERAKEVLQEIVSKYKTTLYNSKTNETVVNVSKVYEMPKEQGGLYGR